MASAHLADDLGLQLLLQGLESTLLEAEVLLQHLEERLEAQGPAQLGVYGAAHSLSTQQWAAANEAAALRAWKPALDVSKYFFSESLPCGGAPLGRNRGAGCALHPNSEPAGGLETCQLKYTAIPGTPPPT